MNIYKYKPNQAIGLQNAVIALGFFDGVHIAHRELIKTTLEIARKEGLTPAVFTFTAEGEIKKNTPRLYSTEERLYILECLGIENVILVDFDDIADLSAEDFVTKSLIEHFGARAVVAGYNFRFGKGARGNAEMLTRLMEENGGRAIVKDEITRDGRTISTTLIRSYLTEGRVDTARELLVTPYFISGRVESGNRVGKTLGFPTINIPLSEGGINLRRGVYLTAVKIGENIFKGLTNVGTCPTFNERKMHTETYILDYNSEIYGEEVKIFFLEFMRDEERFESPDALKDEINKNINDAMKRSFITWQEIGLK